MTTPIDDISPLGVRVVDGAGVASGTVAARTADETIVVPIVEETLHVEKRAVENRLRVRTVVDEQRVLLKATEVSSAVDIQRVPIGRVVDVAPPVREEGNVMIVPVLEEQVFVETRLVLVEEVRITRTEKEVPVELPATRRVMRAVVERDDA